MYFLSRLDCYCLSATNALAYYGGVRLKQKTQFVQVCSSVEKMLFGKLFFAIFAALVAASVADDVIREVIVATSNCHECGMTFFGTISIKVLYTLVPI